MKNFLADGRLTQRGAGTAQAHPLTTPIPHAGRGVNVWYVGAAGPLQQPEGVGVESRGGGPVPPWRTLRANPDCAEFVLPLYSFLFCHL